jgi:hypothetical protein
MLNFLLIAVFIGCSINFFVFLIPFYLLIGAQIVGALCYDGRPRVRVPMGLFFFQCT